MAASPSPASDTPPRLRGAVVDLRRHPLKGFTCEPMQRAALERGKPFPGDRLFAVEAGDCGFDPEAPAHISKFKFAVLANTAAVARVRTRWDDAARTLHAEAEGALPIAADFAHEPGREAFTHWLGAVLGEDGPGGRLRVIPGGGWRFFDSPDGHVSLINLESVRDLARHVGAELDPLRFRANLYIDGWPAWSELDLAEGAPVRAGSALLRARRPIRRCAATHVDPTTAVRDHELVRALHTAYGHMFCGVYLQVEAAGAVGLGDAVEVG